MRTSRFIPRWMECRRGIALRTVRLFVCLSVRLSVKGVDSDKTEE